MVLCALLLAVSLRAASATYALPVTASTAAGTTCASQPYAYGTISLGGYTGGSYAPFNTCGTFVDYSLTLQNTWCACITVCPAIATPPSHSLLTLARTPPSSRRRFGHLYKLKCPFLVHVAATSDSY
jgi:hypothetical protein